MRGGKRIVVLAAALALLVWICDEAFGQRALVEAIVEQAHVCALQMRLVGRGGAPQQPRIFLRSVSPGIDVQIHERARSYTLRFGERRQVRHADIENEHAARAEQTKRSSPGATPIVESEQMRHGTATDHDSVEAAAGAGPVAHVALDERHAVA